MSKYDPLYSHLRHLKQSRWHATFTEIEKILGFTLPKSARNHAAWWGNKEYGSQAQAWQKAGFQTSEVNLTSERVLFTRTGAAPTRNQNNAGNARDKPKPAHNKIEPTKSPAPTTSAPEKLQPDILTSVTVSFNWTAIGTLGLDRNGKLSFPKAPKSPGLYRYSFVKDQMTHAYIGESDNLNRRFGNYRNPGPSQQTNIRLNKYFREILESGIKVSVSIIIDAARIHIAGEDRSADFSTKPTRLLFENAALISSVDNGDDILNR